MIIKRRFLLPILLCWPFVSMGVDVSTIQSAQTIDAALFHAEVALGKLNLTEEQKSEIKQKLQDIATVAKQPPEPANPEPEEEAVAQEPDPDQCPATGNRLKSITDANRVGDFCSSSYIAVGKVKWYSKLVNGQKVCTCLASVCTDGNHVEKGRCVEDVAELATCPRQEYTKVSDVKTDEDALSFCETKGGKQCKTIGAQKDYNGVKGLIICNPTKEESGIADQQTEDQKLHYYNCGDTRQIPSGISCSYVSDFSGYKITPLEADGLMKEYALKKYKDDIKCDEKSHRIQNDGNNYRQCASRKNDKQFYEFKFKDLDAGNKDFFAAVCKIWGLDYGKSNDGTYYVCKKASVAQCEEISAAMKRTFFPGSGEAVPETTKKGSTNCIIKQHEAAIGSRYQINSKATTIDQFKTTDGTDVMHFYDKNIQVNANKSLYTDIQTYLFNELNLPVKPMQCSSGFVDNVMVIPMTTQEYEATRKKQNECASQSNRAMAGSMWGGGGAGAHDCMKKFPIPEQMSDVLPCEYNGKRFDLAFKKLDVKWDKKSTAGYQGVRCLTNGGTFTGKTCALASKKQCDEFKADFEKQFPGSRSVEWDPDFGDNGGCVLKDAKYVANVQKAAETTGMVALTLVTAVAGGPVVWALSVVEGAALVTEAKTEGKLSNWSDKFISDATQCSDNDSGCANAVLKKHIARIIKGSKYFDETQGKAIAKQTTRLMGMLSSDTYNQINDKVPDGINLQNDKERDTVLENAILGYYGTKLTSDEKTLLATKKVATVLTFATLIGGGVMAGLRQGVKRNLFKISKARQAKWLDLKILKPGDVADDVVAMSKTGQKAAAKAGALAPVATDASADVAKGASREMTPAQAKKLEELDTKIAKLEAKTNRTADEAAELKKLRQERNTLLNKVGTKDADEVARLQQAALNEQAIKDAQKEYQAVLKKRNEMADYMAKHNGNPPQGKTRFDVKDINDEVAKAEKKLKDLGQEVTPAEPLQIGKKPTVASAETKPADNTAKPKDTKPAESSASPKEPGIEPATPQSRVYEKLGDKTKADIADIKSGKYKELYIPKGQLTDEEWKILKEDLAKDGLGITEDPSYFIIKKTNNVDDVAKVSSKADDVADTGRGTTKNADDVLDESGKKPKENDVKTGADGIEAINPTAQKLKNLGFTENNGVFISKRTLWSGEIESQLDSMADWKWTYLNAEGSSQGERIYIAMSKEAAAKQGLTWSDEFEDFVRTFNPQSSTNINRAKQLISSGKPITDINGVPVYVRYFGKKSGRPIIMVEINGKKLPFYASSGSAGKTKVATGKWEFFGGIGPDGWFNKGNSIEEIAEHYYSPELKKIAQALDNQVGDVRNVEYVMMSQGRAALNGTGKVGGINGVTELSEDLINSGMEDLGFLPNMLGTGAAKKNIEGVKNWLRNQRASTSSGGAKSTGTGTSGAKGTTSKSGASSSTSGGSTNKNTSGAKSTAGAKGAKNVNEFDDMLSRSNTLKNLNAQGRLQWVTSSSLNGKQYMRIRMGKNPDMNEAQKIIQNLRNEGFYVSSNTAQGGEKFLGVSREDIFTPWNKSSNNWAFNHADDMESAVRGAGNAARNAIPSDFSPAAKNFINEINEIGTTREYAVARGIGPKANQAPFTKREQDWIRQYLANRDDLIARNVSQPDGSGGNLGANWFVTKKTNDMFVDGTNTVLRRINTRPINNLRGKSITTINGKSVFLEPLDNGGFIGNVSGRPVVVVNYNGHKIPFYASSGEAGKLDVPTGKWEVFFGFGKGTDNPGWFNKGEIDQIVGHYGSPELKKIAEALDNVIGDQRNIEDIFATISRRIYNGKGIVASYDGPVTSKDFINRLLDFTPADYYKDGRHHANLSNIIEHVKSYFK